MEEVLTGIFDNTFHMRVSAFSSVLSGKRIQKTISWSKDCYV